MANKDVFDEKMDALAESINAKAGTSGALTLDGMKSAVDAIELGSNVVANPTLEGGEDDLTSIEIDGTKYAIPEGTSVEANPTLAGTEANLTGLEVDGTKYKVPSGTEVQANPTLAGTEAELTGLEVGGTKYKVPSDYLPLSGGTIGGDIIFGSSNYSIQDDQGNYLLRGASTVQIGTSAKPLNINTSAGSDIKHNGTINVLDASNTSANSAPVSTAVTLNALKMNGVNYKVRDGITNGLGYLTTAPTADNTDGIKIVVLSAEPATKYAGYLYIITA